MGVRPSGLHVARHAASEQRIGNARAFPEMGFGFFDYAVGGLLIGPRGTRAEPRRRCTRSEDFRYSLRAAGSMVPAPPRPGLEQLWFCGDKTLALAARQ